MNGQHLFIFGAIASLSVANQAQGQSPPYFTGFYGGFEGGAFSYNTQITFDGVDDPAGRGGVGYGAFFGYNRTHEKFLVGAELLVNLASEPDPYTFDRAVVGFAELDLRRGASAGLDIRAGYLVTGKILLYGCVGYSANKQSVRIDGVPLERFAGGAAPKKFAAFQFSTGIEFAIHPKLRIRFAFRTLNGYNLRTTDFGTIPIDASLTRFDVEPDHQQFLAGLMFRL